MADRHRALKEATERTVLEGPGQVASSLRQALHRGEAPDDLRALVAKIRDGAYEVTDGDLVALRGRYSEDALFEIIVATTLGAADHRLGCALKALEEA